jgi:hypothetical protein
MIEHVKKLTEEARKLSPEERIEFLRVLSAMVDEDGYDSGAAALAECQHPQDDIGGESRGHLVGKSPPAIPLAHRRPTMTLSSIEARSRQY